ncbi:MAG TPA: serine/threonine-protein kinase, partial [Gemmataceae bacterium]|nr:serine/threonine-protein kinase [Gemmataceae bacterium]
MQTTPLTSVDEDARRQFEAAWRNGQPESFEKYLPPDGHPQFLATLEELIHIEMEMAWKRFGQANTGSDVPFLPLVEQYFMRYPALRTKEVALRLVRQEFLVRQRFGDRPEPDEYKARFPQLVQTGQEVETLAAGDHVPAPTPIIPGYDILEELGHGGMGVVYKARQHSLKRLVALKMILSARATEQDLARFRIETEAVAQLQHPNIAQIYEVGEYGRRPFCSLEFVDGGSLAQKIAGTPQPVQLAAGIVEQLARAVQSAHDKGIIHRDLKPANVLLTTAGLPKITDFGLAKRLE